MCHYTNQEGVWIPDAHTNTAATSVPINVCDQPFCLDLSHSNGDMAEIITTIVVVTAYIFFRLVIFWWPILFPEREQISLLQTLHVRTFKRKWRHFEESISSDQKCVFCVCTRSPNTLVCTRPHIEHTGQVDRTQVKLVKAGGTITAERGQEHNTWKENLQNKTGNIETRHQTVTKEVLKTQNLLEVTNKHPKRAAPYVDFQYIKEKAVCFFDSW